MCLAECREPRARVTSKKEAARGASLRLAHMRFHFDLGDDQRDGAVLWPRFAHCHWHESQGMRGCMAPSCLHHVIRTIALTSLFSTVQRDTCTACKFETNAGAIRHAQHNHAIMAWSLAAARRHCSRLTHPLATAEFDSIVPLRITAARRGARIPPGINPSTEHARSPPPTPLLTLANIPRGSDIIWLV